jgi:riboflavin kinase/FMN adenylyltransferase
MIVYESLENIDYSKNRVISVGSFDGVHSGHKALIQKIKSEASINSAKSMLITFDPHPQIVVKNPLRSAIEILNSKAEKIKLLEKSGLDELLIIPFDIEFSMLGAQEFVEKILIGKVGFSKILVGYDHLFGKDRKGDYDLLSALSQKYDFSIEKFDARICDGEAISSSRIRNLLKNCEIEEANKLLSYNYIVEGEVVVGNKIGRTIGFPTANIKPFEPHKALPGNGVYLTKFYIGAETYFGMANIGLRPTVTEDKFATLEINIFDFDRMIYGESVCAEFIKFIRPEQKFDGIESLIEQLKRDKQNCKKLINMFSLFK